VNPPNNKKDLGGKTARRKVSIIISAVILSLTGIYIITQKISSRIEENQKASTDDARKARALEILVRDLNPNDSIDLIVESLEKFQSNSETRNNVGVMIKDRLSATAKEIGVTEPEVSRPKHSVMIILPADIMFKTDTNKLSASAKTLLKQVTDTIEPFGNEFNLTVTGHTAPGDFSKPKSIVSDAEVDAWIFSASRAASVVSELIKQGARPNKLRATGLADTRSLFPVRRPDGSLNPEAAKKNRRIEVEITSGTNKPAVIQ